VKNRCARRDKYLIFQGATRDVCVRTDVAMIANPCGMTRCAPDHCVLKDDAVCANLDRAALRYQTRAKHNPAMCANRNVTAHGRGWGDVSRRVNSRFLAAVGENHAWWPNENWTVLYNLFLGLTREIDLKATWSSDYFAHGARLARANFARMVAGSQQIRQPFKMPRAALSYARQRVCFFLSNQTMHHLIN